jgi:peptidoglycan glycosyltransferase
MVLARRNAVPGSLLLCLLFLGSVLAGCGGPPQPPPNPGARGSIYDRNGVLLAYTEANAQAAGGYQRRYCFPSLSPILGYFHPSLGEAGLEAAYDSRLASGQDIYLTIDMRVQNMLDAQYDITRVQPGGNLGMPTFPAPRGTIGIPAGEQVPSRCQQQDGDLLQQRYNQPDENARHNLPGSIVVSDPKTGEILGMLSRPYFNADKIGDPSQGAAYLQQLRQDGLKPLLARPTNALYTPGAIFDTVTLSAALDSGQDDLTTPFGGSNCLSQDSEARRYVVNGHRFQDIDLPAYSIPPKCPIDLEHGYIYSDNIISARVGVGLGAGTWLNYVQRFGISDSANPQALPVDFSPKASRLDFQGVQSDEVNLAADAFGQGTVQVSPLEMAFITSAIANNGVGLLPHLLYKAVPHGTDPKSVKPASPTPYTENGVSKGQIISPQTAAAVREAMRGVVQQGSATIINGTQAQAGGKTGTAQLENADPHSWFISLAPDGSGQTPQYAVVVLRENGDEGLWQAPVADCIFLSLLNLPNVHKSYQCAG